MALKLNRLKPYRAFRENRVKRTCLGTVGVNHELTSHDPDVSCNPALSLVMLSNS